MKSSHIISIFLFIGGSCHGQGCIDDSHPSFEEPYDQCDIMIPDNEKEVNSGDDVELVCNPQLDYPNGIEGRGCSWELPDNTICRVFSFRHSVTLFNFLIAVS